MLKNKQSSRREFLKSTAGAVAAFSFVPSHVLGGPGRQAPSEKLNIACIGVGGRGGASVGGCRGENIVAMCDVDTRQVGNQYLLYSERL